jgi:Haem-binding domain
MTKTLKSLFALAAVAVIVGQMEPQQRPAIERRNQGLPLLFNSEPAHVLVRACGNCHSNHTDWPWYSHVAPASWWIARDVREGRESLNLSEWETYSAPQRRDKLESICGLISTGRMPPRPYRSMHPESNVTEMEKEALCDWANEETIGEK